ncbi:hypothetical protein ACFLRC_01080 [Candidatus Altiarchaeota archaeon]
MTHGTVCGYKPLANAITKTHFRKIGEEVLYDKQKIKEPLEELMLSYFIQRFPTFLIVLETQRGVFSGCWKSNYYRKADSIRELGLNITDSTGFDENIWHEFYESQQPGKTKGSLLTDFQR